MITIAILSESVSFLIFYILKFVAMVLVVLLAVFAGVKLRKFTDARKAKKAEAMVTEAITADGAVTDVMSEEDK